MSILKRYWPWIVPVGFLLGYELVALLGPAPTLSALVWEATAAVAWLDWAVIAVGIVLAYHFFFQKRGK
jgi:hypothetical protein